MFDRPRLRLVAVMLTLFLLGGLFPQQTIAQDGDDTNPLGAGGGGDEPVVDDGDGTGPGSLNLNQPGNGVGGVGIGPGAGIQNQLGNVNNRGGGDAVLDLPQLPAAETNVTVELGLDNTTGVECYSCEGKEGSDCQKVPQLSEKERCTTGYCYQEIHESSRESQIIRRTCAHAGQIKCLEDKPDMCKIFNDIPGNDGGRFEALGYCFVHEKIKANDSSPIYSSSGRGNKHHRAAYCVCNTTALCNDRISVSGADAGLGRDPVFICAVVMAALLISTSFRGRLVGSG